MNNHSPQRNPLTSDGCISQRITIERDAPIIISGWLKKMRQNQTFYTTKWDKRWVVIQNGSISWKHSSQESQMKKSIPLIQVQDVYKIEALKRKSSKDSGKIFVVKSKKRNLCLKATTKEECDKWVRAIRLQLDLICGGTFAGPQSIKNQRKRNGGGDKYDVSFLQSSFFFSNLTAIAAGIDRNFGCFSLLKT